MPVRCTLICACLGLVLTGCQSTDPTASRALDTGPSTPVRTEQTARPSAVFPTGLLAELLGQRGLAPGFAAGDWEYGRRDALLSVGARPMSHTFGGYIITQRETLYENDGRIRTYGRRTVHSIEGGQVR